MCSSVNVPYLSSIVDQSRSDFCAGRPCFAVVLTHEVFSMARSADYSVRKSTPNAATTSGDYNQDGSYDLRDAVLQHLQEVQDRVGLQKPYVYVF